MDIWKHFQSLQGQTLRSLSQGKPFDVTLVQNNLIIITPQISGKPRPINRIAIEGAFSKLKIRGEITRREIEEEFSPRNPTYIAALLSQIPGVGYNSRPIIQLFIK